MNYSNSFRNLWITLLLLGLSAFPCIAGLMFSITDLGTLGGHSSVAYEMNEKGQVVGQAETGSGLLHAFLWDSNTGMQDLQTLGGTLSDARGINEAGKVVGWAKNGSNQDRAFLWDSNTGMQGLGTLGGNTSRGFAINDSNQVIGWAENSNGNTNAFLWTDSQGMQNLGTLGGSISNARAITDGGLVLGHSEQLNGDMHAFLWDSGSGMQDLGTPGSISSRGRDVNDNNQAVIDAGDAFVLDSHAFLLDNGVWTDLGTFGGAQSGGRAINSWGQVVGHAQLPNGDSHAFFWENGQMIDLNDCLSSSSGWVLERAFDINDHSQIVGYGTIKGETHAYLMTPVPISLPGSQPDLLIQQENDWLGNDVYNPDGTDQTGTQKVVTGTPAVYQAQLYNDGDTTETFWIKGAEGNADWTVDYYWGTEVQEDHQVTDQVVSEPGWEIPDLPPGEGENFIITVTPNAGVAGSYPVLVTATPDLDDTLLDAIQAVTTEWPVTEGEKGHYYEAVLVPEGIDWNDANAAAIAAGGYLATITSEEENELVYNLVKGTAFWRWPQGPWLGGRQQEGMAEPDAGWEWVTGETWDYTHWYEGEPNDYFEEIDEDRLNFEHGATWNDFPQTELTNGYVVEYMEAHWQPDLWIKNRGSWQGDDIYHPQGENQVGRQKVEGGTTVKYLARLYNDGDEAANFWIQGPGGDADWTVQYYRGTQVDPAKEVTAQVTSPKGWKRVNVPPGARRSFVIAVTPTSGVVGDCAVLVKATSEQDLAQLDCIQAVTTVPDVQPDLHIKKGPVWGGDDIYNDDGTDQKASRKVTAGSPALFRARLENDGTAKDHFYIYGPAGNEDWTVQYYRGAKIDASKEVTVEVTSAEGWKRPNVAPGKVRSFLTVVTPRSGLPTDSQYVALVLAEARTDASQRDTIKIITRVKAE